MDYLPILEVTRGKVVESIHYGAFVVADSYGNIHHSWGSEDAITFLRSSAKPYQAISLIEAGGIEHFGLSEKQIALICASHSGSDEHVEVARSIQELVGVTEDNLVCGTHPPADKEARERLIRQNVEPGPIRHNCSGKHSGMLAFAVLAGESIEGYCEPDHPIQLQILKTILEFFELDGENIQIGIDGCSVPTFAVPLKTAATAFARLADPTDFPVVRQEACKTIWKAMTGFPEMVSGHGRFDTQVMIAFKGSLIAKGGAEGYQGMAIAPGAIKPGSPALGIAMKISDGDAWSRARGFLGVEILRDLGLVEDEVPAPLKEFANSTVRNWKNLEVGELRSLYRWNEVA
jgi:L-asparaginase II